MAGAATIWEETRMGSISRRTFVGMAGAGALTTMVGATLSACATPTSNTSGVDNTTTTNNASVAQVIIAMGTGNEPEAGFDPFFGWAAGEHSHEPLIQSTLITTTVDMDFKNDLATTYEVADDGMLWTFTIRDDVKFTNGTTLVASDVAFTLNSLKTSSGTEADLSMIREAVAPDDTTVEICMERPYNALLYTLAVIGIVPEHAYGSDYGEHPIGSGRYLLEQWDRGQQIILAANPDYYGEAPKMQRVIVVFMEEDAALAAVRSGQVDMAATSAVYSGQTIAGYDILACKSVDSRGISLPTLPPGGTRGEGNEQAPTGNVVTSDIAIRRALNYAIDRDLMVQNVLNGYGTVAFSVSDGMPWSSSDMQMPTSINEAGALLVEAGWIAGADGIVEKNGTKARFELCYPANDSVRQSLANEFANQVREVGIEVIPVGLGWDEIYPRAYCDPILWGWGSNSPVELYSLYHSEGSGNFACYEDASVDAYLEGALKTSTIEESFPLWKKAQWDGTVGVAPQGAATWVWLANIDHLYFKRDNLVVAQQKLHPHGHGWAVANNVDQWTWK
jgi:peptide/nickel transport system substrate-binding protein